MPQLPSGLSARPESFAPSGESNLRLQRAIESLNLTLDDELHRYRHSRSGQSAVPPTPARLQLRQNRKPIDLIALKTAAPAAASKVAAPPPPPNARLQELLGQSSEPSVQAYPPKAAVNQVRLSHGGTLTTYRATPEDYLESSEALLGSLPTASARPDDTDYEPSLLRQLTTPLGMGALLLLLVGSASFGYLVTSPQAVSHLTDNPITRRFKEGPAPEAMPDDQPLATDELSGPANDGFQPVGPDLSEKEFASLDLNRISTLPSATSAPTTQNLPGSAQTPEAVRPGDLTAVPSRPGAPGSTSTPVGSEVLRSAVVTAPGTAASSRPTTAQPSAVSPARVSAPTAPAAPGAAPQQGQRVAPPAPLAQPPQPLAVNRTPPALAAPPAPLARPAPVAPPAPLTQAPPVPSPSYYVVTDYTGAQSLESARGAVGDAYVRNFSSGPRIQMGAFSQQSSAQNLVNQLQGQGIPAQVISP